MRLVMFVSLALNALAGHLSAQGNGTINVQVVDEEGRALGGARVKLLGLNPTHLLHRNDVTNENGHVKLSIPLGTYMVCAGKEEDGYADTLAALYATDPAPVVTLTSAALNQSVVAKIGPRAAVLSPFVVTDAVTGKKIDSASVTLKRLDNEAFVKSSAQDKLFVPALTKVSVEVHAAGYADWFYPGYIDQSKATAIVLRPGQALPMNAALQPLNQ